MNYKLDKLSLQEYLSLGYLYLLVVGLVTDAIYYAFLSINIFSYAGISDILLAPLGYMARIPLLPVIIAGGMAWMLVWNKLLIPQLTQRWPGIKLTQLPQERLWLAVAFMVVALFLGLGIGMGTKRQAQLRTGELQPDHVLTTPDKVTMEVKILGQNSLFLFYVLPGTSEVTISPISMVAQLRKLPTTR